MKRCLGVLLAAALMPTAVSAAEIPVGDAARDGLWVTFYGNGFALIEETRAVTLAKGDNSLAISGLPTQVRADSLRISGEGMAVKAFGYDQDLLTPQALLRKFIGKEIIIARDNPKTGEEVRKKATLLSLNGGAVFDVDGEIITGMPGRFIFPHRPEGLRDSPTLTVQAASPEKGARALNLSYLAGGFGWSANYVAILDNDNQGLALTGRAAVTNNSGMDLGNAAVAVMAGDVEAPVRSRSQPRMAKGVAMMAMDGESAPAVTTQSLGDRHLYSLPGHWTLNSGETKLVTLFDASAVKVDRRYVFNGQGAYQIRSEGPPSKAQITIKLKNSKADGLGMALPAGQIHAYQKDETGRLRYIGQSTLRDIPVDNDATINLGEAFDISMVRTQTAFRRTGPKNRDIEASWKLEISNGKDQPVVVDVEEMFNGDWNILESSHKVNDKTAAKATWTVRIPAHGSEILSYAAEVRYR